MTLSGTEQLGQVMHIIAQSLIIPCYGFLLYFVVTAVIDTGSLFGEIMERRREGNFKAASFISELRDSENIDVLVQTSRMPSRLKRTLEEFLQLTSHSPIAQRFIAQSVLGSEETALAKKTERTELVSKMGPLIGLMGTLIPLGPGLVGLGKGDFAVLSQYLIVSFDATILGIFAGGLGFTISKIRRRWYDHYLGDLEAILETIVEVREHAAQSARKAVFGGRV